MGEEEKSESPESEIIPYEDINTKQAQITGEKFPEVVLGICDNCHWCYTSQNRKGVIENCPSCNNKISMIPMSIDEICVIEFGKRRGLTIRFERMLPLR